jgi:hypothetical protein
MLRGRRCDLQRKSCLRFLFHLAGVEWWKGREALQEPRDWRRGQPRMEHFRENEQTVPSSDTTSTSDTISAMHD